MCWQHSQTPSLGMTLRSLFILVCPVIWFIAIGAVCGRIPRAIPSTIMWRIAMGRGIFLSNILGPPQL